MAGRDRLMSGCRVVPPSCFIPVHSSSPSTPLHICALPPGCPLSEGMPKSDGMLDISACRTTSPPWMWTCCGTASFHSIPFHSIPFHSIPFHSIPASVRPFHSSQQPEFRSGQTGEVVGESVLCQGRVMKHCSMLCGHPTAHPVSPFDSIPFRVISRCRSSPILISNSPALTEDSSDATDGTGVQARCVVHHTHHGHVEPHVRRTVVDVVEPSTSLSSFPSRLP
jgi:hypothetical protein